MSLPREIRIILCLLMLAVACVGVAVAYTDICHLRRVTLNGEPVVDWRGELGLYRRTSIFNQPLDSLAEALLARPGMRQVKISYALPDGLDIRTNTIEPVCFFLDSASGRLYGVDNSGRIVPARIPAPPFGRPIISGARMVRLYDCPDDPRVPAVVADYLKVRERHPVIDSLLAEIDLSDPQGVSATLSDNLVRLELPSDSFGVRLQRFMDFQRQYPEALYTARDIDLRYQTMLVCANRLPEKRALSVNRLSAPQPQIIPVVATDTNMVSIKSAPTTKPNSASVKTKKSSPRKSPSKKKRPTTKPKPGATRHGG